MINISRILIDATSLRRKTTGIEYYTLQIVQQLLEFDKTNEYLILFRGEVRKELLPYRDRARFFVCSVDKQLFCEQIWIPYMIKKLKPDIVHFPAFPPGLLVNHRRIIFTLHDAVMWKFKSTLSWKNKVYMKPLTELALKKSRYIFTVSQNSRINILDVFPALEDRLVLTGESISGKFKVLDKKDIIEAVKVKYNTGEQYLLSVCSLEPRKNIPRLLEAYSKLVGNGSFEHIKLVLVGRKAWGNNVIGDKIEELGLKDKVIITDYVSDDELLAIYNGAYCFIYPSLFEGFGLPVLEAMACGVPVITSSNSSLPEVAGEGAIYVNAEMVDEIFIAMKKIIEDSELRNDLVVKGQKQLDKFSWRDITDKMVRYYTED